MGTHKSLVATARVMTFICQSLHQGLLHWASSSTETQQCSIHAQHAGLQCAHVCSKMKKSVITHNVPPFSYAALLYLFFSRSYFWLWYRTPSNKKCCKTRGSYWDVHTTWQWQACVQLGYFLQWRMPNPLTFFILFLVKHSFVFHLLKVL